MNDGKSSIVTRYRRTTLSTPSIHLLHEVFASFICLIYWLRWQLSRPLQIQLLPKWTTRISIPGLTQLSYLSYGEVFLSFPILFLLLAGYYYVYVSPDVELSGNIASYFLIAAFLMANKSCSIFSFVLGIPFERMLWYHKLSAVLGLAVGAAHTNLAFETNHGNENLISFAFVDVNNALGSIIFICTSGLVLTSFFSFLRRWNYDIWLFIHIGLAVIIALPWASHSVNLVWIPLFWFAIDVFIRYVLMARCYYARTATLRKLRSGVIELRFRRPRAFQYNAGQYVRIAIPQITSFQFHPFSLSSAPHEEYVTLHIRPLGNWTKKLQALAGKGDPKEVQLLMEGPYGSLSVDLTHPRYGMVLCVSGGIGVTHCRSIARSLIHDHIQKSRYLEQLRFVWTMREPELLEDLPPFEKNVRDGTVGFDDDVPYSAFDDYSTDTESVNSGTYPLKTPTVRGEVYLTSSQKGEKTDSENSSFDQHRIVVHEGQRPDLSQIVKKMKVEAERKGITHIAAFACGPRPLTDALREICRKESKGLLGCKGVTIDLHVEIFEF